MARIFFFLYFVFLSHVLQKFYIFKVKLQRGGCKNNMRYPVTELGHTLSHRVLLPSRLELNQCVGKCDLIHGIDGDIPMTNQARMRLLRYVKKGVLIAGPFYTKRLVRNWTMVSS